MARRTAPPVMRGILTSLLVAVVAVFAWIVWGHGYPLVKAGPSSTNAPPQRSASSGNDIGPDGRDLSDRYTRDEWGRPFWENRRRRAGTGPKGGVPPTFTDVSDAAGLVATGSGPGAECTLNPQMKGTGLAVFDADGNGWDDVFIPDYSQKVLLGSGRPASPHLFRNLGGMHFEDVTAGSGLDIDMLGTGVAVADVDRDGRPDLILLGFGDLRLMHNDGGFHFRDITAGSGLHADVWPSTAAFFDYDNDGWLDLLILGYTNWSQENSDRCGKKGGAAPSCLPPLRSYLFKGRGDGTFEDVSERSGISSLPTRGLGVLIMDLEGDGYPDIFVANDGNRNYLFSNQKGGRFREIGLEAGVAYDAYGNFRAGMGVDGAYLFHDDRLCFAVGFFEGEETSVYCQDRADRKTQPYRFVDAGRMLGVGKETVNYVTFGVLFLDYDLDGWEDLLTANGHISNLTVGRRGSPFEPMALYQNIAGRQLGEWILSEDSDFGRPLLGRALAMADFDHDGDPDVIVTQNGGKSYLFRNETARDGHHALVLRFATAAGNVNGIGAAIDVRCGALQEHFYHTLHPSFMASSSEDLIVGLGACTDPADVSVHWPLGQQQHFANVVVDHAYLINEGRPEMKELYTWTAPK